MGSLTEPSVTAPLDSAVDTDNSQWGGHVEQKVELVKASLVCTNPFAAQYPQSVHDDDEEPTRSKSKNVFTSNVPPLQEHK